MMIVEAPRKLLTLPTMAAALLLVVLLLASKSPQSEARPVVGLRGVDLSATMPAAGVALPKEEVARPELHHARDKGCGMAAALEVGEELPSGAGGDMRRQKLGEVYGPLLLSMLPRGPTPPSAPSKGNNDIQT